MTKIHSALLLTVVSVLLYSCDSQRIYESNIDFDSKVWVVDLVKSFEFGITDINSKYNLYFNIRNTSNYPFQNLYVQYWLEDSSSRILSKELLNFQLFHPQTGVPFGSSSVGDIFDHQLPVLEDYKFVATGTYVLKFQQMMRTDTLAEVLSVGARVEYSLEK